MRAARNRNHLEQLIQTSDSWLPTVRQMRPEYTWHRIANLLNSKGQSWTDKTLRKSVKLLIGEGLADASLLKKAPRRPANDDLVRLVAGIANADPSLSLRKICSQLEAMREKTPQGSLKWAPSSVKNLLNRAERLGLKVASVPALEPPPTE